MPIQLKRGIKTNLPTLNVGEPAFTTDTNELYIGGESENIQLAKKSDVENLIVRKNGAFTSNELSLFNVGIDETNNRLYIKMSDGSIKYATLI